MIVIHGYSKEGIKTLKHKLSEQLLPNLLFVQITEIGFVVCCRLKNSEACECPEAVRSECQVIANTLNETCWLKLEDGQGNYMGFGDVRRVEFQPSRMR